ncbi:hypothetical protein BSKO_03912 [Bryopsis sp. KO-2023]|nr:hypothetical protein BSKO_03912 [Bryopsis sp. KO-2023]
MSELLTGILAQIQDMDESHSRLHEEVKGEKQRREIRLEENYRSTAEELDAAHAQLREARREQASPRVGRQDSEYDLANSKRELSQLQ